MRSAFRLLAPWAKPGARWSHYIVGAAALAAGALRPALPKSASPSFHYVPSRAPLHVAPPVTKTPTFAVTPGAIPQVYGLRTADTGVDISAAINRAAAAGGFSAPGYAALIGVESAFRQYAPHYPINGAGPCDFSGGLTQITVCTAAGLGIGNGSESQANINYVFWYEQADANRDVAFSGELVRRFKQSVCWDFAPLYAAWNLGPGYGCLADVYVHPNNPITINAVADFAGWWNWVWASHVRWVVPGPRPTPRPFAFPRHAWFAYCTPHHLRCEGFRSHGHRRWAASVWLHHRALGGVVGHERWFGPRKGRRYGYTKTRFAHGAIFTWPRTRGVKVTLRR